MTDVIELWWSNWGRYSAEELAEHDMVPTSEIEAFEYVEPYPTDGPVPCDNCRGQGATVRKQYESDQNYRIDFCYTCHGTTELEFLCSGCGAQKMVANARVTKDLPENIIQHQQWCPQNDLCMTMISSGARTCCRPIVARFDVHADGKMWGFCGVHSRGKQEEEERSARWVVGQLEDEWRASEKEKKEATIDERLAAIKAKLGMELMQDMPHRQKYDGSITVTVPLEILEAYVGAEAPEEAEDLASLVGFEAGEGPEPF